jgi:hypothetical protein
LDDGDQMTVDYQQVLYKIRSTMLKTAQNNVELKARRAIASGLFHKFADQPKELSRKVEQAGELDPYLRCALPGSETLNASFPLQEQTSPVTILAADGSQIIPDRHASCLYSLVNVGLVALQPGSGKAPDIFTFSDLKFGDELYTETGLSGEDLIALGRDLAERQKLLDLAENYPSPVVALTDGPVELWGGKDGGTETYRKSLDTHLQVMSQLQLKEVILAGFVEKPGANLVIRMLEVADLPVDELKEIRKKNSLRGVSDRWLFSDLPPGARSAVFGLRSRSSAYYKGHLALHFFYLNTGSMDHPNVVRVEIPAWVAMNGSMLNLLHSSLIAQCRILGVRPYPYILHRAHEVAVVTLQEKQQVEQILSLELHQAGLEVDEESYKLGLKKLPGRGSK